MVDADDCLPTEPPLSLEEELARTQEELRSANDQLERRERQVLRLAGEAAEARADAERANSAKEDFLATLSHELRTPLSSMLLNAQRLRSGNLVDRAAQQRAGESLERATWAQVKLIDDLLDVSRIVGGKLTLNCAAVDLSDTIRVALDSVKPLIEAKSQVLRVSLDSALHPIWADRVRVQQVVSNLLTNAITFTPRDGQLTIVVDADDEFLRLRVADTGVGIEADFLPHVFASFSQSDSSITRKYGGLGLGLALVRLLVELHGGTVLAESAGAGQGTTLSVTFPLARGLGDVPIKLPLAAQDAPVRAVSSSARYAALAGLRVLFIDDDLQTREAIQEVLVSRGAVVELAASAAEGLAAVERFKPQVILCDIAMPGQDGYTFIRKLRARESGQRTPTPALALTALTTEQDRGRALVAGFHQHMSKPIDIDDLREAVLELSKLATHGG